MEYMIQVQLARGSGTASPVVQSVAICAGSGGSVIGSTEADLYFTGEMSHVGYSRRIPLYTGTDQAFTARGPRSSGSRNSRPLMRTFKHRAWLSTDTSNQAAGRAENGNGSR